MSKSKFKLRISTLLSSKGFGLAESMVSIGIIGIIVMTVISQQKVSNKSVTALASDTTINDIVRMTLGEITDQSTCEANFKTFSKDKVYLTLKNGRTGQNFLVTDGRYGIAGTVVEGNKTVIGEVQVSKIETQHILEDNNPYAMILRLTFKRKDVGGIFSSKTVTRDIPINTVMNGAVIGSCFGDFNLLAQSAVKASCVELSTIPAGTSYVSRYVDPDPVAGFPYGKCVHDPGDLTCPNGTIFTKVSVAGGKPTYVCGTIDSSCTDPGKFIVGFNDTTGAPICDYPVPVCANPDQVLTRSSSGRYVCTKVDCSTVVPVSAFAGFYPDGTIKCNQITQDTPCPSSYASEVTSSGKVTCSPVTVTAKTCPAGTRINSVDAAGTPICTPYINLPFNCANPLVVRSIDVNGNAVCGQKEYPLKCGGSSPLRSNVDCSNAGGTPANLTGTWSQCYFAGTSCPGGWARCSSWTKQADASCTDTSNTFYCNGNIQWRPVSQGGMAEVNTTALASTTCYQWQGAPNNNKACNPVPQTVVSTSIQYVGCY